MRLASTSSIVHIYPFLNVIDLILIQSVKLIAFLSRFKTKENI